MIALPYVQGVMEPVQRVLKQHDITSAVRPHRNLRQILVHPKDKMEANTRPIVCTKFHVRHAICVTLEKREEHFVRDLMNTKQKLKP